MKEQEMNITPILQEEKLKYSWHLDNTGLN